MLPLIHGGDLVTAREKGLQDVLDFSANINPLGPPEGLPAALAGPELCERYPDPLCRELAAAIAARDGVPPGWVLCGGGASDLIYRLFYALRPREALLAAPCFAEYERAALAAGCRVRCHRLREEEEFRLTPRVLDELDGADLVFLCSPNNPTGQPAERALLAAVLDRCARNGAVLALDECFNAFLDEPEAYTMRGELGARPRLVLFDAFTKLYALPGLRLGYCLCSDAALLRRMDACGPPWSVSGPAQRAGVLALRAAGYPERTRELVKRERAFLRAGLERLGCRVYGSRANFLFFRPHLPRLRERLEPSGILVRDCGNFCGLDGEFCRIAVRARAENERLLAAMEGLGRCR